MLDTYKGTHPYSYVIYIIVASTRKSRISQKVKQDRIN